MFIDDTVTLDNIIAKVKEDQYLTAFALALRLNEQKVTQTVYSCIPIESMPLICANFPNNYLVSLMTFLAIELEKGPHFEWTMIWV